ncbi:DHS-like NAD/FAD-binding domain-containing protein [Polyplosphaeria fusca]|uniref:DHS-like NAD/FAD-binding domain-containing protein n=1 Tax=Polyplosphaeria fusca TaxID=682080 RepID=A0A9P4QU47_9PLEO|nr:DHS-like NAD/FAD-binding domain-containing protein [Polyplosphaeria fusca]
MSSPAVPDYSAVVSATGFLRPRASRSTELFHDHLSTSRRLLVLIGAGLSAASGLPTFRGQGGLWRKHDAKQLSTPAAFEDDPALVWTFYLERIRAAKDAKPNAGHLALVELAEKREGCLTISMNIDGLSERARHAASQIHFLHGSLFDVKCNKCDLLLRDAEADTALQPLLVQPPESPLQQSNIPHCPKCHVGLLRPGVVWFTEPIPSGMLRSIHAWIEADPVIDTMLVVGTSAEVYPATAYIEGARKRGARVAAVNIEQEDPALLGLEEQDWYFQGDAAELVPQLLEPVIGRGASVE